jgi:hypothetical protein
MGNADPDPTFVASDVIHPVWTSFAKLLVNKSMPVHLLRLTLALPFSAPVLEPPDQRLLFRLDRDHRQPPAQKIVDARTEELELRVAIGGLGPFSGLAI